MRKLALVTSIIAAAGIAQAATVAFSLSADKTTAAAGEDVTWTISVEITDPALTGGGNTPGLALAVVDLVQDGANPILIDIPQGDEGTIPAAMAGFSRPAGISNPGENGATTGYVGVQRGTAGEQNLVQLGGGQNTFGQPGTVMGTDATVDPGVALSSQVLVSGTLQIPAGAQNGEVYTFSLANGLANVLESIGGAGVFSPVQAATVDANSSISITVGGAAFAKADMNCDGNVDAFDISPFILALTNPAQYAIDFPGCDINNGDVNNSGTLDAFDISPFITCITSSGCP
jgi:hypothetical protein